MRNLIELLEKCKTDKEIDEAIDHVQRWATFTPASRLEQIARPYREKLKKSNLYKKDDK